MSSGSVIVPSTSSVVWYEGGACSRREVVSEADALRDIDMRRGVRGRIPDLVLAFVNPVRVANVEPLFWPAGRHELQSALMSWGEMMLEGTEHEPWN